MGRDLKDGSHQGVSGGRPHEREHDSRLNSVIVLSVQVNHDPTPLLCCHFEEWERIHPEDLGDFLNAAVRQWVSSSTLDIREVRKADPDLFGQISKLHTLFGSELS